ncbi:olfactory receptor 2D3-like [Ambystoma mexicanum]|uniref:olfactory receptor 2D3-like n=1 Tax=Ambystoma mexicanum TaxID=8296 RepID=UPI0037E7D752
MDKGNQSFVTEFILTGLSTDHKIEIILFVLFLFIYLATLMGNLVIIIVTQVDSRLRTPMYFFLSNLSFIDITYTSVIVPKMLNLFLSTRKTISFAGCITQVYICLFLGETECLLLAIMAYDRYVAICNPLHYATFMSKMACRKLAGVSWMCGFIISLTNILMTLQLPFCGPNRIDHFFCETPVLLKLACADIVASEVMMIVGTSVILCIPLLLILTSYCHIISTIVKMHYVEQRHKAFSTCGSHLMVVSIFYGTAMYMYMRPRSENSDSDKAFSVFYTIIIPMLNPLIYSLRNKDVKQAIGKTLGKKS